MQSEDSGSRCGSYKDLALKSAMLFGVGIVEAHSLTKHHSTKDELLSNLLVFCEGTHVQGTGDYVKNHKGSAYWYVDNLCRYAA
jgi:hypothetical protein